MRFIFKTNYDQDINIVRHNGDRISYGLLVAAMIIMPFFIDDFYLGEEHSYLCLSLVHEESLLQTNRRVQVQFGFADFEKPLILGDPK